MRGNSSRGIDGPGQQILEREKWRDGGGRVEEQQQQGMDGPGQYRYWRERSGGIEVVATAAWGQMNHFVVDTVEREVEGWRRQVTL